MVAVAIKVVDRALVGGRWTFQHVVILQLA